MYFLIKIFNNELFNLITLVVQKKNRLKGYVLG